MEEYPKRSNRRSSLGRALDWVKSHKLPAFLLVLFFIVVFIQLLYPSSRMVPFVSVDGKDFGMWSRGDVIARLDQLVDNQKVDIYLGGTQQVYSSTESTNIGVASDNTSRVESMDYPWYLRVIPLSILWHHWLLQAGQPSYSANEEAAKKYLISNLGFNDSCKIMPKDASLKYENNQLKITPAQDGGTCETKSAVRALGMARPTADKRGRVKIDVEVIRPTVSSKDAEALKDLLLSTTDGGVSIDLGNEKQVVPQEDVLSWLNFTTSKNKLDFTIDNKKSSAYLNKHVAPKVSVSAGITRIATRDFTVLSKKAGANGRSLDVRATQGEIKNVLSGTTREAVAKTMTVKPRVLYSRTYTKTGTGISAQLQHYSEDNSGVYGISFVELGGQGRSAEYNSTRAFTTASTYKLFVAYGTIKKIEDGKWKWGDSVVGGRDVAKCFDEMIVLSDNPCAEALLKRYGYNDLTRDIQSLGLYNSGFYTEAPKTTARDLTTFLTKLKNGSLGIRDGNKDRLLNAMSRNVYRQGIPAGTSGKAANKVGFLGGLLHDASVVYSPKGDYVLVIMTDGSSWAKIADLTRKIEALR